jgi:multidrug efflux pump subunit AcrA (membrane-fusion protein)
MTQRTHKPYGPGTGRLALGLLAVGIFCLWLIDYVWPAEDRNFPRITQGEFRPVLVLTGSLTALRSEEFKVPITQSWRIQIKWMAKEGDSVKPGDPVVRFDTANLAAELETTQDSVRTKREEKAQKEADYRHQKFELEVAVKQAENDVKRKEIDASIPEGIESHFEFDRKQLEKKKSDHLLESAETNKLVKLVDTEAQIKTLEIEIGELEANLFKLRKSLDELTLTAHSAGAFVYAVESWSGRKVQVGDTVYATRTVAQIPDLTSLRVQAWVSETHVQQIQAGQAVDLYLDAYPENLFHGVIKEISQTAEAIRNWGKSNYFTADIEMDKLDLEIMKPGMSVKCDVLGTPQKDVLLIPLEMTFFDGQSFWVKPDAGEPLKVNQLGFNEFVLAASLEKNPGLRAGLALHKIDGLEAAKDIESDEGKTER